MTKRRYARRLAAWGSAFFMILAGAACSSSRPGGEVVGETASAITNSDVLGFESTSDWTLTSGTPTLTTNHTQGSFAFSVIPNGYLELTSVKLSTLSGVTGTLAIDFGMPATVPNPSWLGQLQIFASIPSQNINNVQIGQTDLSTLKLGQYNTVQYTVPSNVLTALKATYSDLTFGVVVNVAASTTTAYLLDNLRFLGGSSDAGTDSGKDASADSGADSGVHDAGDAAASCGGQTCPSGTACAPNATCVSTDLTVWPNIQSQANSDTWLSQNHTSIRLMQPRVLAINFANTSQPASGYQMNSALTFGEMKALISSQTCAGVDGGTVGCAVFDGLDLGSRYHGYSNASAPQFLQYQLAYAVDMSDKGKAPSGWNSNNSSLFPVKCNTNDYWTFDYGALFSQKFAAYYNIRDASGNLLTLTQAVQKGLVHDVFVYADGDDWVPGTSNTFGSCANGASCPSGQVCESDQLCHTHDLYACENPDGGLGAKMGARLAEVLEWKQNYTNANPAQKVSGSFNPGAGNGTFETDDQAALQSLGVSIRITYVNSQRGPGCAIHSMGHAVENQGSSVPTFQTDFTHFANYDLATKSGNSLLTSWYSLGTPPNSTTQFVVSYAGPDGGTCSGSTNCNAAAWDGMLGSPATEEKGTISLFNQGCGNVHFPPNARKGYDDGNTDQVLSTCENYGLHNGTNGVDKQTVVNSSRWQQPIGSQPAAYDTVASDCEGGWQIVWRQSFPGFQNTATGSTSTGASNGVAIKNWWPYLYY